MKHLFLLILLSVSFAQINYENDIQPIFNTNCVTCHNTGSTNYNQHLLDLSSGNSYSNLYNVTSTSYAPGARVVSYNAESSVIYHKMSNSGIFGGVMPPAGELDSSLVNLVTNWINDGAFLGTGGRISGSVTLTEDHPFGQVQIILYLPGGGTLVQQWGEDPPFDLNYFFEDPAIAEGGPYRVESYFDLNDNNQYDGGEPYFTTGDLFVPASNVLENVDLQLVSGGTGGEYSYDFEMGNPVEVFDGTVANDIDGSIDFSIEFWIMFHSNPEGDQILFVRLEPAGVGYDMELRWNNSNQQFELSLGGPPGTQFGELIAGGMDPFNAEWHHIYIQYLSASNRLEFFWDGALTSYTQPSASTPSIPYSDYPLQFGTDLVASMDEVRIRTVSEDHGSSFPIPTTPYTSFDVDENTLLLWHCNENGGLELIDDGFYNNVGWAIFFGSWDESNPWGGGGGTGFSIDFGSTGEGAAVDFQFFDPGQEITLEMFIKLHNPFGNAGPYELFIRQDWGYLQYFGQTGEFRFSLVNIGEITWQYSPNSGEWHHIAADYDGTNMNIYWDGELKASTPANGQLASPNTSLQFGPNLDALADIIRVSGNALYAGNNFDPWTQIYPPNPGDLPLLYHCNEGSGNQLIDVGGNGYHATLSGNPTWDPDEPLGGGGGIGLWFTGYSSNFVDWEWTRWPDADSEFQKYEIRRQVNNPGVTVSSPSVYVETDVNVVNWRDNDITEGNNYYYKLYMYDQAGIRYETGEVTVTPGTAGGHVDGNISSNESESGQLIIGLFDPGNGGNEWDPNHQIELNASFPSNQFYQFDDPLIGDAVGWQVKAFLDQNSNSIRDDSELYGESVQFTVSGGNANNIDFELVLVADYPVITNFSITSGNAYADGSGDVEISVELNASSGISEAKLIYYQGGSYLSKLESALAEESGVWVGSLPDNNITMEGLMVQVFAKSNNNDETTSGWYEIPVYFNSYTFNSINAEQYAMVSFPGDLDNDGVKSVLENNLGSYDATKWRSFSYNYNSESYDENSGSFKAGNAFWVISRESVDLTGNGGKVTSLQSPYTVTLERGWNMIGNPYAFRLDFPSQVTATGNVESTLHGYNGSGYISVSEMVPGEGYWIWSYDDGTSLDFDHQPSGGSQKQLEGGWQINLQASINGYHDSENRIGVHPQAKDEQDAMDAHEPPVIGNYVQLAINNADWKDKGVYSKDIRREGNKNYFWNVVVKSNIAGQIRVDVLDIQSIPSEFDAVLVDLDNMIQHDLFSGTVYKYVSIGDEQDHHFQVVVGLPESVLKTLDDLGILPYEFSVDQNVPNPFNPVTAIRIQLVEDAVVSMKVFNLLGKEVRTLINSESLERGYRQIIWNGRDNANRQLPSGLYLYQTMINNNQGELLHMNTKKMILVK